MSSYTVVIILAIVGALCLALMAAARRWPGEGRWSGRSQDQDRETGQVCREAGQAYMRQLMLRQLLLQMLCERFGELPAAVVTRIQSGDPEWCEEMLRRAATANSLEEMGF